MADKAIQPELKLISSYLRTVTESGKEYTFVVPEYQRAYAWLWDKQCDKLWEDIMTFIRDDRKDPYFFGTVIIDASHDGELSLIDGQQRTTTFILLMKALLVRIEETLKNMPKTEDSKDMVELLNGDRKKIIGILYKADAEERIEIDKDWSRVNKVTVMQSRSINEQDEYRGDLKKILQARTFADAEESVYHAPYKRTDNKYSNFFRNYKFFYNKIGTELKDSSAIRQFSKAFLGRCQIIEIKSWQTDEAIMMFNSLNSTGLPLNDADIISAQLSAKAKVKNERDEFNQQWQEINSIASRLDRSIGIGINALLQQYMHINTAINERDLNSDRKADVTVVAMRDYYTDSHRALLENPLSLCAKLKKLALIWDEIKDYPIIKLVLKYNMNIRLFLASYLYRFEVSEISRAKVQDIAECLMRLFTLMELVPEGYSSSNFKIFLFTEQIKLVRSEITIDEIKEDFNRHISNKWRREDIDSLLQEDYDKNILVFLNEYLYAKKHELNFDFDARSVQVEHIMPMSGHNIEAIRHDAGFSSDETGKQDFKALVNKIGNKILLEEKINKSIGNEWFKSKKGIEGSSSLSYALSKYPIAKSLSIYPSETWTKVDIDKATGNASRRIIDFVFDNH